MHTPRLRYWRDYRALTLRELAAQAGVAYRTVWRAENGYPTEARTVRKLAEALGVEPLVKQADLGTIADVVVLVGADFQP